MTKREKYIVFVAIGILIAELFIMKGIYHKECGRTVVEKAIRHVSAPVEVVNVWSDGTESVAYSSFDPQQALFFYNSYRKEKVIIEEIKGVEGEPGKVTMQEPKAQTATIHR